MRATVLYSPGDVRCVEVEQPKIPELLISTEN